MLPNCLKSRKNKVCKDPKVARTKNERKMLYQNAQCVIVKNPNLSKSKKLLDSKVA